MDKQILKIQIQSDLKELEKDINLGVYDRTPEELIKLENKIWEKIEKFIDELQAESEKALKNLEEPDFDSERKGKIELQEEDPEDYSPETPIGGSIEPYDIEREKALIDEIEAGEKEAEELTKNK